MSRTNIAGPFIRARARLAGAWLDAFAVGASAACLVHCLGMPLLLALIPAAASLIGTPEWFHVAAFALAVPASTLAMRRGYRHHGIALPAALGALGLLLLALGALCGFRIAVETGLTVSGSVVLAIAHLRNWRLQREAIRRGCGDGCAAAALEGQALS